MYGRTRRPCAGIFGNTSRSTTWVLLLFFGALFLMCVYLSVSYAIAGSPKLSDLCYYNGEGEATYNARSGLRVRVRIGTRLISTRRDRSLPDSLSAGWLGHGSFEIWTDSRPTRWIAGMLGRQIWQLSKDGQMVIPYELTAHQERVESRIAGPVFVLFFWRDDGTMRMVGRYGTLTRLRRTGSQKSKGRDGSRLGEAGAPIRYKTSSNDRCAVGPNSTRSDDACCSPARPAVATMVW